MLLRKGLLGWGRAYFQLMVIGQGIVGPAVRMKILRSFGLALALQQRALPVIARVTQTVEMAVQANLAPQLRFGLNRFG